MRGSCAYSELTFLSGASMQGRLAVGRQRRLSTRSVLQAESVVVIIGQTAIMQSTVIRPMGLSPETTEPAARRVGRDFDGPYSSSRIPATAEEIGCSGWPCM